MVEASFFLEVWSAGRERERAHKQKQPTGGRGAARARGCAAGAGLDAHTPVWASHPPAGPGLVCPRALPPSSHPLQSGKRGERPCLPKKKERDWVGEREKKTAFSAPVPK